MVNGAEREKQDYFMTFGVPLLCVLASGFLNIVIIKIGIGDQAALNPTNPTVLDVSLQLVFLTVGTLVTLTNVKNTTIRANALTPAMFCFFALCLILGIQAITTEKSWTFIQQHIIWFRIIIPDIFGAMTVGLTIWYLRSM